MELLRYWKIVRKSLWIIILILIVALASTAYNTMTKPLSYQSTATLLLNPAVPSSMLPYVQSEVASNLADSYDQLLHTRSFGESVVKGLPFYMDPGAVGGSISTKLEPNTLFFRISASRSTPEQSKQLVDTVVEVFLAQSTNEQSSQNGGIQDAIKQRLEDKLTYLGDQIKQYNDEIVTMQKEPRTADRDDQLMQMRGMLVTLQESETNTMLTLAQLPSDSNLSNTALVIDPALPGRATSRNLTRDLSLAASIAILLGLGLAFLRDYMDSTIRSPEHLEEILHTSPLGIFASVGTAPNKNGESMLKLRGRRDPKQAVEQSPQKLTTLDYPNSSDAERFRIMRTNLQFSNVDKPVRTVVVTSAVPGEGKSFIASNLAVTMAQSGKRVILVDADLRKPVQHKLFDLRNSAGFTNLIAGTLGIESEAIHHIPRVENLAVITSGPIPPNPSELLNSNQAAHIMQSLASRADMVIYDAPPAGVVTDPLILAARTDATLLIIRANSTRKDTVARIRQTVLKVGAHLVLPVLNRVQLKEIQYDYYSYGSYSETPEDTPNKRTGGQANALRRYGRSTSAKTASATNGKSNGSKAPALVGARTGADEHIEKADRED